MPALMPKFLLYSCLFCAHGCVYMCTLHTDSSLTARSIASIQGTPHTHTHDTRHTTNVELGFPTKKKFAHMIFLRVSSFNNQRYSSFLGHTKGKRYSYFTKAKIFMHEYFDMNIQPCISTFLFDIKWYNMMHDGMNFCFRNNLFLQTVPIFQDFDYYGLWFILKKSFRVQVQRMIFLFFIFILLAIYSRGKKT